MQGDVSVLPPNLDLMATASNHSKKLRHETSFFRCFTQNHALRNLESLERVEWALPFISAVYSQD